MREFRIRAQGRSIPGDEDIDERREPLAAALRDAFIRNPRQLVEFKPAIGVVFQEYLRNYSHWAFGDFDILMGDMNSFPGRGRVASV